MTGPLAIRNADGTLTPLVASAASMVDSIGEARRSPAQVKKETIGSFPSQFIAEPINPAITHYALWVSNFSWNMPAATAVPVAHAPDPRGTLPASEHFICGFQLASFIAEHQADAVATKCLIDESFREEVSERLVEAFADLAYRKQTGRPFRLEVARFGRDGVMEWCDNNLSKILVFELNIELIHAREFLDRVCREFRDYLGLGEVAGDWGRLLRSESNRLVIEVSSGEEA